MTPGFLNRGVTRDWGRSHYFTLFQLRAFPAGLLGIFAFACVCVYLCLQRSYAIIINGLVFQLVDYGLHIDAFVCVCVSPLIVQHSLC